MIRKLCALLFILVLPASVLAAQPSVVETNTKTATVSNDTITLADVSAGNGIGVFYLQSASGARVVSAVTDDAGNTYTSQGHMNCNVARCIDFWVDFSAAASGTLTITVDQSSTFVNYGIVAFEFTCPSGTCSLNTAGSTGVDNAATTNHFMSPTGELDTSADVLLVGGCSSTTNLGARTPTTGFETDTTNLGVGMFWQYEDDVATAYTDERQNWTSGTSATNTYCRGFAIKNTVAASNTPRGMLNGGILP